MNTDRSPVVIIFNQNISINDLCEHVGSHIDTRVILVSTHDLFPSEKEQIRRRKDDIEFLVFGDLLDDALATACDEQASKAVHAYLAEGGFRFNAVPLFTVNMTRLKNYAAHQALAAAVPHAQFHHASGLGIDTQYWTELGSVALPPSTFGEAAAPAGVTESEPEFHIVSADGVSYIFLATLRRLTLAKAASVVTLPIPDLPQLLNGKPLEEIKAEILSRAAPHIPAGNTVAFATTIHGYQSWHGELGRPVHLFVDGYHPPNYPRSYSDSFDRDAVAVSREPVSLAWFHRHGLPVRYGAPILPRMDMKRPVAPDPSRRLRVLFALNHAGDWTALINRSDTDRLVIAAAEVAKRFPSMEIVVRPHPTMVHFAHEGDNSRTRIVDFIEDLGAENCSVSNNALDDDIRQADVVISEYSQVLIDSLLAGKLGVIVNLTKRRSFMQAYEQLGFHAAESLDQLFDALARIRDDRGGFADAQSQACERYNSLLQAAAAGCPMCGSPVLQEIGDQTEFPKSKVYECARCGHAAAFPLPGQDTIAHFYKQEYSQNRRRHISQAYLDIMINRAIAQIRFIHAGISGEHTGGEQPPIAEAFKGMEICDVGCGIGALVAGFQNIGAEASGFDSDDHMIGIARSLFSIPVSTGDLNALDALGVSDIFCLSHVLEHFSDPVEELTRLRLRTRPGGHIFIEVPNSSRRMFDEGLETEGHLHFFKPNSLRTVMERAGWQVINIATCGPTVDEMIDDVKNGGSATVYNGTFEHYSDADGFWIRCIARAPGDEAVDGGRATAPRRAQTASTGNYVVIDREEALTFDQGDNGWDHAEVALNQEAAYRGILEEMRSGRVRTDFAVAAAAIGATGLDAPSVLEVGCASGYYRDVFAFLLGGELDYRGVDRSAALIELAQQVRPDAAFSVGDARRLPFDDGSADIVFNGVSLMHIVDYETAIAESRRVARRFCVFHTVPVLERRRTTFLRKVAYGRPLVDVILNEAELRLLFARHGLAVRQVWNSIDYDLHFVLGERTPTKTFLCEVVGSVDPARPSLLNIGCGGHFHPNWLNVDMAPLTPGVLPWNVLEPLPFAEGTFDVVYHSHVLEHLPKEKAPVFLQECYRLLKPGGVLRVAIPDLEQICRLYIDLLDRADKGDTVAAGRYDWILLELFDQMVRNVSGGDMLRYFQRNPLPEEDFVVERIGGMARRIIENVRAGAIIPPPPNLTPEVIGHFRLSGEIHQWMYDRFSLRRLLEGLGFSEFVKQEGHTSGINYFADYGLDVDLDNRLRKADSLYVEVRKPVNGQKCQVD